MYMYATEETSKERETQQKGDSTQTGDEPAGEEEARHREINIA